MHKLFLCKLIIIIYLFYDDLSCKRFYRNDFLSYIKGQIFFSTAFLYLTHLFKVWGSGKSI